MKRLDGRVTLVTGAARGIGRGIALCFAAEGADVVIVDIREGDDVQDTVAEIEKLGQRASFYRADVSNESEVIAMVDHAVSTFGRLDIAVANAAIDIRERVVESNWDNVLKTLAVSQFGVFHTCKYAAKQMLAQEQQYRSRGKILITGSVHEELPVATCAAYNMAKAAINHFSRTFAGELAHDRINVNVINPGWIRTPGELEWYTEDDLEKGGQQVPWGRIGEPEDIGRTAVFLCSDDADYITGAALRVDGGYMVGLDSPSGTE